MERTAWPHLERNSRHYRSLLSFVRKLQHVEWLRYDTDFVKHQIEHWLLARLQRSLSVVPVDHTKSIQNNGVYGRGRATYRQNAPSATCANQRRNLRGGSRSSEVVTLMYPSMVLREGLSTSAENDRTTSDIPA